MKTAKELACITLWFFLFLAIAFNLPEVMPSDWFMPFQKDAERLVVGRLQASMQDGFLSHGGILMDHDQGFWNPYESSSGFQGVFFDFLNQLSPFGFEATLAVFHGLCAAFLAAVLTAIVFWFGAVAGVGAAVVLAVGLFFSPWLLIFGRNMFWVFGLYFLPFLASTFLGERLKNAPLVTIKRFAALFGGLLFIKCGCDYNYVSAIVLAGMAPLCFYALRDAWSGRQCARILVWIGGACCVAAVAALLLNSFLLAHALGQDWIDGIITVLKRWDLRMGMPVPFDLSTTSHEYEGSIEVERGQVISLYLHGLVLQPAILFSLLTPSFSFFILVGAGVLLALKVLIQAQRGVYAPERRRTMRALAGMTLFSLSAPLSWFCLAPQHSAIHIHINPVLWYVPFGLCVYALAGAVVEAALRAATTRLMPPRSL